jgi:hypothetical protein
MRIVVCGSIKRNGELIERVGRYLRRQGHTVFTPRDVPFYPSITPEQKAEDNKAYREAIKHCDAIYIVNNGYTGPSTYGEIAQAIIQGKKIYYFTKPNPDELELLSYIYEGLAEVWQIPMGELF